MSPEQQLDTGAAAQQQQTKVPPLVREVTNYCTRYGRTVTVEGYRWDSDAQVLRLRAGLPHS